MKSLLVALSLSVLASGCASTLSSVSIPNGAPWNTFETTIASPYSDLEAQPVGMVASAEIEPSIEGPQIVVACKSDQGKFFTINVTLPATDPSTWDQAALCNAQAAYDNATITNITPLGVYYLWNLVVEIDPSSCGGRTSGGVEVGNTDVSTLFAISFNKNTTGSLNIGAGVSQGTLPGPGLDVQGVPSFLTAEWGHLLMGPSWNLFGVGELCADGTTGDACGNSTTSTPVAVCEPGDIFAFKTNVAPKTYKMTCGSVPVNLTMTGGYPTVGACIDTNIKNNCSGLKGQNRSACVHAQIGTCHATFNVPGIPK